MAECPDQKVLIEFMGDTPLQFSELEKQAKSEKNIVAFKAKISGFIVLEKGGAPVLLVYAMDNLHKDPNAAQN